MSNSILDTHSSKPVPFAKNYSHKKEKETKNIATQNALKKQLKIERELNLKYASAPIVKYNLKYYTKVI